jgi:hypothetical protein
MKIEIPYNEDISRKQTQMLFDLAMKNQTYYWKNSNYWGLFLFLLGVLIIVGKSSMGYIFVVYGIFLIVGYYVNYYKSNDLHKRIFDEFESTKNMYLENPLSVWEFSENALTFSMGDKSVVVDWKDFKAHTIKDDVIFMFTKSNQPFILEKEEVGDENYEKIVEIVTNKILLSR